MRLALKKNNQLKQIKKDSLKIKNPAGFKG